LGKSLLDDDEQKLEISSTRPEFRNLSEPEVWEAIGGGGDPAAAEVTRLAVAYLAAFKAHADRHGSAPHILHVRVRWPIEKVAMMLVVSFMRAEGGAALPFTLQ